MKQTLGILSIVVPYLALTWWMPAGGDVALAIPVAAAVVGGALIAGGLAKQAGAANEAADAQADFVDQLNKQIRKSLSPEVLLKKAGAILPKFRELESIGAIPGFQSAAETGLSRLGLDDTGLGAALTAAAGGAGELQALTTAIQTAKELNIAQASLLASLVSGASVAGGGTQSPLGLAMGSVGQGIATGGLGALGGGGGGGGAGFVHTARPKGVAP